MPGRDSARAVLIVARDGTPLRAFPDRNHIWRHPVRLDEVSPLYLQALLGYEDRYFRWHPGVNPVALVRAAGQWASNGHIVSGGSTLTMQVARILDAKRTRHTRTPFRKLRQILRALQLELRLSKREILTLYLNHAPMGGIVEGVEMASRLYVAVDDTLRADPPPACPAAGSTHWKSAPRSRPGPAGGCVRSGPRRRRA